jgi:hypothetical protein
MPVPTGMLPPEVAQYLTELEARIAELEDPGSPKKLFACTTAGLPSPAEFYQCGLLNTTLNIMAHSDGSDWIREDTGAAI